MQVRFLNGGYCRQLMAVIDRRTWRWSRFHAVFLAVQHPREGWILIDAGYGTRFAEATARWPFRIYRFATPTVMTGTASGTLEACGVDPELVRHVILTHFHADHVGGLGDFPRATLHYHTEALAPLVALKPFAQVRAAFLPALIPENLAQRSHAIAAREFAATPALPFRVHDLFGDGSLQLVYLPGHAPGHCGVLVPRAERPLLYAADAFWIRAQIEAGFDLRGAARALQWDPAAYERTIAELRGVSRAGGHEIVCCHARETQEKVTRPRGLA